MAQLPTPDAYNEAVQTPRAAFADQRLAAGNVACNGFGIPKALGGGFAITYRMQANGKEYAVRCFHKEVRDLQDRYRHIHACLKAARENTFVEFEYQPTGIRVKGNAYPVVTMEWISGPTLGSYLDTNYADPHKTKWLRSEFALLESRLHQMRIAHGDIQNGNVIVENKRLRLIDYDGMYVPAMPLGNGTELGQKHFQHQQRKATHFGPDIERFAFIAVDLSLWAIANEPSLFKKYSTGENILFTANDYADPNSSELFLALRSRGDVAFKTAVGNFARVCKGDVRQVPRLPDFLESRGIPAEISAPTVPVAPVRANYIGAFPVIDASSFQSVCKVVGDRVELVGQIVELKHGTSRKRTPYLFINFGHWRDDCVRLTVWSEGLQSLGFTPDASWKGKWVSVTGMVDPVYNGTNRYKTISYRSVGITIAEHSQLREISRDEAAWRLGKTTRPQGMGANAIRQGAPQQSVPQKNQEIIDQLKKGTKPPPYPPASAPISPRQRPRTPLSTTITSNPSGVKARNEQLLKSVQQASPTPSPPRLPQTKPPAPIGKGCAIVVALLAALLIYGQQFGSSSSLPSAGSIPTTSQLSKAHLTGKVTAIADGDTITVLDSNRVQHKIRLDGIDAPESGQPFGTQAKKAISDKVFGREVNVVTTGQDRYGRTLGHVYLGNRWINRELVEEGWAWHYVQYSRDAQLAVAETKARQAKIALWADPNPIAPWAFRHSKMGPSLSR